MPIITRESRRRFLGLMAATAGVGSIATLLPQLASADALPPLAANDPMAQALAYVDDAAKIDATKSPTHKTGQTCANCRFFGGDKAANGPCQLFPGKSVAAKGWCSGYNVKA